MNNTVFGKTLENIAHGVDIRLITSDKAAQKLAAKPNYDRCTILDEKFHCHSLEEDKALL